MGDQKNLKTKYFTFSLKWAKLLGVYFCAKLRILKSIPWRLVEFYYNRGLQRRSAETVCQHHQETINKFICQLIVFLKSKTLIKL